MEQSASMVYENPIVREAIVFVRFEAAPSNKIFSAVYALIHEQYPTLAGATDTSAFALNRIPGYSSDDLKGIITFTSEDEQFSLSLSQNLFALHVIGKYPGWVKTLAMFEELFKKAIDVIKPSAFVTMGLRYLNLIEQQSDDETLGYWLQPNDFLPKAVLESFPVEDYQLTVNRDNGNEITEITIKRFSVPDKPHGLIVWDIFRCSLQYQEGDERKALEIINRLHDDVSGPIGVFSTAIGPNLHSLMNA